MFVVVVVGLLLLLLVFMNPPNKVLLSGLCNGRAECFL